MYCVYLYYHSLMEQICDPIKPWAPSQLPQPPGAYPNVPLLASCRTAKYYIINECCLLKAGASSCLNTIYELFSVWETRGPSLPAKWLPSTPEPTKEMLVIGSHVQVWCIGVSCVSIYRIPALSLSLSMWWRNCPSGTESYIDPKGWSLTDFSELTQLDTLY